MGSTVTCTTDLLTFLLCVNGLRGGYPSIVQNDRCPDADERGANGQVNIALFENCILFIPTLRDRLPLLKNTGVHSVQTLHQNPPDIWLFRQW